MLTGEAKQGVWEAGPILLPLVPGNESACIRWGTRKTKGISIALQRSRPPSTPQKPKIRKSVAKPRHVSRRGLKRRRFVLKDWLARSLMRRRRRWEWRPSPHGFRVWTRSMGRRGKVVKKKSARNHKIFGAACRTRLLVVVVARNGHNVVFLAARLQLCFSKQQD